MTWQLLGGVDPKELGAPRIHAHWAAQVIAAVGETLLDHEPDTSHTALYWSPESALLKGQRLARAGEAQIGLRFDPFELVVQGGSGTVLGTLGLAGRTLEGACGWALETLTPQLGKAPPEKLIRPEYALPAHVLGERAAFGSFPEAHAELERWFANAHKILAELRTSLPDTSQVTCWPHHFDTATLTSLERDASGEATKTLGVGFSPGDEDRPEPYWYVNHWPAVFDAELTSPPAGEWHTEGWVGSVLPAREIVRHPDANAQHAQTSDFLRFGIEANRRLVSKRQP